MTVEPFLCKLVARLNEETVPVDFHGRTECHIGRSDEGTVLIHVLVLGALQEFALNDTRVLLGGLEDGDGVVCEEEGNDEAAVDVLGHASVEAGCVSQDSLVVVNILEEVSLRLGGLELVNIAEGVNLVAEAVMRRDLSGGGLHGLGVLDLAQREDAAEALVEVALGEFVDARYHELAPVGFDHATRVNLIARQVIFADLRVAGLAHSERVGKLPALKKERKAVAAVVRVVYLSDLESIICEVVVNDEGESVPAGIESEDLAVAVEELLLRRDATATEGLFHELLQFSVSYLWFNDLFFSV